MFHVGSTSTGSTKSATMELYTASSYNETMSGGGETLSSISEKSCISGVNHHNGEFPPQAYLVSLARSLNKSGQKLYLLEDK